MIKVRCYKTEEGLILSGESVESWGRDKKVASLKYWIHDKSLVNGKELTETFHKGWNFLEGESKISTVQKFVGGSLKKVGWKLKNPKLESESIPLQLTLEQLSGEVHYEYDEEVFTGDFKDLGSLYELQYEREDDYYQDVEFEVEDLGTVEVSRVKGVEEYKVIHDIRRDGTPEYQNITNVVNYNELAQILVDPLFIHENPCSISSRETYRIVRNHIKNTINSSYAVITSDYDFCFEVKKRIHIEPYTVKTEEKKSNGRSYAKPRFSTKTYKEVLEPIFRMTHEVKGYQGYPIIQGFKGDSLQDLIENVKGYLDVLTEVINAPLEKCKHCEGTGVVHITKFNLNDRGNN